MSHEEKKPQDFYALTAEETLKHLEVHEEGLTSTEAERRLAPGFPGIAMGAVK